MSRARWCSLLVLGLAGCDQLFGLVDVVPPTDASPDVPPPTIVPFGAPVPLEGAVLTALEEDDPSLTGDLLELYFVRASNLYVSTRLDVTDAWPAGVAITELNTGDTEVMPRISADGLTLYFSRSDGTQRDIYVTTRATRTGMWSAATPLAIDLNRADSNEHPGWSSTDGLELLVETWPVPDGDHELYRATRVSAVEPFTSVPLDGINTVGHEGGPWATSDGATIVFESNRAGTMDVWEAARYGESWVVANHQPLNSTAAQKTDGAPWLSADGQTIVFSSSRTGNDDLYIATR